MRVLIFLTVLLCTTAAHSQAVYDSLTNIPPAKISCLYGQTATIVELSELYPAKEWKNKITDAAVINKQYKIVKAEQDESRPQVWIHLISPSDTLFYRLTKTNMTHPPFLVNGFFEKQKQLYLGKSLKLKIDYEYTEVNSGKVQAFTTADTFKCTGLSYVNTEGELIPSYTLTNTVGSTINVPLKGFETVATNTIDRFTIL